MPVYTVLCQSMALSYNTRMDELILKIQLGLPVVPPLLEELPLKVLIVGAKERTTGRWVDACFGPCVIATRVLRA